MKVIAVSHRDFAKGILSSVQMLLGSVSDGEEVIIASDLFHGTPFNVCVKLSEH